MHADCSLMSVRHSKVRTILFVCVCPSHLCSQQSLPQPRNVCHCQINMFGQIDPIQVIKKVMPYLFCQVVVAGNEKQAEQLAIDLFMTS